MPRTNQNPPAPTDIGTARPPLDTTVNYQQRLTQALAQGARETKAAILISVIDAATVALVPQSLTITDSVTTAGMLAQHFQNAFTAQEFAAFNQALGLRYVQQNTALPSGVIVYIPTVAWLTATRGVFSTPLRHLPPRFIPAAPNTEVLTLT